MKRYLYYIISVLFFTAVTTGCQTDFEKFDNRAFISDGSLLNTILLHKETVSEEKLLRVELVKPAEEEVLVNYRVDAKLVEDFNLIYKENAIMLPEENFELSGLQVTIPAGSMTSTAVTLSFKNLNQLNRELTYVLPVTLDNANLGILESQRTSYYVIKEASLIYTSADITKNRLTLNWNDPYVFNYMRQLTVEALVYIDEFDYKIATVMGIENEFLIRFGDQGIDLNQLQIAAGYEKATSLEWCVEPGKWTHIAIAYDADLGNATVYIDGVKKETKPLSAGSVSWGHSNRESDDNNRFWIGYSWEKERDLNGKICECRIWNRILTEEEINSRNHFYDVEVDAAGLLAYWKFNEAEGRVVKDYTANGNHLGADENLKWIPTTLPVKK